MSGSGRTEDLAASLRAAFDASFVAAPEGPPERVEPLLSLRAGGDPYALRMSELREVTACPALVLLPGSRSELLGLAGLRGVLVPVYSLAALLGYAARDEARWIALAADRDPVAFAFDELDGTLAAATSAILPIPEGERTRAHVEAFVRVGEVIRPVVRVVTIVRSIRERIERSARERVKER